MYPFNPLNPPGHFRHPVSPNENHYLASPPLGCLNSTPCWRRRRETGQDRAVTHSRETAIFGGKAGTHLTGKEDTSIARLSGNPALNT